MTDYYEILGVSRTASEEEIKKAYRHKSRQYHPDIAGPEFEEKFKEVNSAYEVLSDPDKRQMYDAGVDPNNPQSGYGAGFSGMGDMGDIFSSFFGSAFGAASGSGPIPRTQPGRDSLESMTIDLRTAVFGGNQKFTVDTFGVCNQCGGSGSQDGSQPQTCPDCHGSGQVQKMVRTMLGTMMSSSPCPTCQGHGTVIEDPCTVCHGQGRVRVKRDMTVSIPAGIVDDARIRLAHQGEVGECGGPAGDLYIDVRIKPDRQFTRQGNDLHCWIRVPMSWAVLGHTVEIDTFDGMHNVDIPAGCQPEQTVTVKNLGVTDIRDNTERGDLIVHVNVEIPTKLNDKERSLIEQFCDMHDDEDGQLDCNAKPVAPAKKGFFTKLKEAFN
ncbi:molecular chaperone DnaJ [Bifidobacterium gallicum]|uniref:Chaperone protein DnaJ n=1 Tax=Bifidobacterium gallicum DSM 20093 = LMG 11596 TaxID=561180 RepID=D1NTN0_9BIFI|nr:molecular chaperone DnaJ [Bifidobacterium gallicum]EFA23084.1 putative chaperone protein DnaJ [Bifidobacterium gallicum DSM 20093 = LMG 11596]KFI58769.1 molecular chaperone DnaJ [Bifidobacterium gallicum DSM 20093 = LMG 11596]